MRREVPAARHPRHASLHRRLPGRERRERPGEPRHRPGLRAMSPLFETPLFYFKPYPGTPLTDEAVAVGYRPAAHSRRVGGTSILPGAKSPWATPSARRSSSGTASTSSSATTSPRGWRRPLQRLARWRCDGVPSGSRSSEPCPLLLAAAGPVVTPFAGRVHGLSAPISRVLLRHRVRRLVLERWRRPAAPRPSRRPQPGRLPFRGRPRGRARGAAPPASPGARPPRRSTWARARASARSRPRAGIPSWPST